MKLRVAIIKGLIPTYREGFYDGIFANPDLAVSVFCQPRIQGSNLKSIHEKYGQNVNIVRFLEMRGGALTWQFLPWHKIFSDYDVVFVEGNPRNITHFLISSFLRLFNKKVVLWTMAHSYRANQITESIRLFWSRIFGYLFVYTDGEVEYLRARGFSDQVIIGMNNGLDQKKIEAAKSEWPPIKLEQWIKSMNFEDRMLILSCSRLEEKNSFDLIIQALPDIIIKFPNILWCVIGDGAERENLERLVLVNGLSKYVFFVGGVYQETKLAPWFMSSELLVHPAAIGLTTLHAFGYGLPLITHSNANFHGPEFTTFQHGITGYSFIQNNVKDLSKNIIKLLGDPELRAEMKINNLKIAREKYNIDVMVSRFVEISKLAFSGNRRSDH